MFSIIVPVYNVEAYIEECLESIYNQTFSEYEVIIVNDGSTDKSLFQIQQFMKKHQDSRFKIYHKDNGGLSSARNYGIEQAKRNFLIFVDSDDYIDETLLEDIYKEIQKNNKLQIIRYPKKKVDEKGNEILRDNVNAFHNQKGEKAFQLIRNNRVTLETAWTYCIEKNYWLDNEFHFPEGKLHEDLGTIPRVIVQAKWVSSLNIDSYYNYRVRSNSIMTTVDNESQIKKLNDTISYYKNERDFVEKRQFNSNIVGRMYIKYFADAVLLKICSLSRTERVAYRKLIKEEKVFENYSIGKAKDLIKIIYYKMKLL